MSHIIEIPKPVFPPVEVICLNFIHSTRPRNLVAMYRNPVFTGYSPAEIKQAVSNLKKDKVVYHSNIYKLTVSGYCVLYVLKCNAFLASNGQTQFDVVNRFLNMTNVDFPPFLDYEQTDRQV